ncbi:MAG TPA: 2-oxo-4-hydroxy-4-carboxy-5-ureidoimidazoline decarboxylase, partial [Rhizobacter sp.]|nr:2-oxo-4-hydroxy-4-carboxy-5-ureidoimidazoline decarboxylase [Rhizobacter sp.]
MSLTLDQLNAATLTEASQMLAGIYEHSPWIAEAALAQRPFKSLAHLKQAMADTVRQADRAAQLALIRAH